MERGGSGTERDDWVEGLKWRSAGYRHGLIDRPFNLVGNLAGTAGEQHRVVGCEGSGHDPFGGSPCRILLLSRTINAVLSCHGTPLSFFEGSYRLVQGRKDLMKSTVQIPKHPSKNSK